MTFDKKEIFDDLEVIGQVDKKFIAAISKGIFLLFDQHAVHERIRLETLIDENYLDRKLVLTEDVSNEGIKVRVPLDDLTLLDRYKSEVNKFGLYYARSADKMEEICLLKAPKCFMQRELKIIPDLISSLLRDIVENLRETRGASSVMLPKTLHSILSSQACRSALKFGDKIHLTRCKSLMSKLSQCSAPFQCAHGRPSIAPIVDMNKMNELNDDKKSNFNLEKLRALKSQ